jgi:hypothetical protein
MREQRKDANPISVENRAQHEGIWKLTQEFLFAFFGGGGGGRFFTVKTDFFDLCGRAFVGNVGRVV